MIPDLNSVNVFAIKLLFVLGWVNFLPSLLFYANAMWIFSNQGYLVN